MNFENFGLFLAVVACLAAAAWLVKIALGWEERKQTRIQVIHSTSLTLAQWRNSPELVAYANTLLADPKFQTLLDVLRSESPSNYGLTPPTTHDDQIAHSYKGTGYNLCLNNLEALATLEQHADYIEATFEREAPRSPRA